eukprot:TRINITY_DN10289_c0_g1_i7.p1 TRINITY_DN10289_c0_g1~~TRINITY_DN10289_c0_g1_i7.p1  ORF type:complete len:493 (+),score=159.26 TRINITY_DN10289_c0_g1_i7:54-1532(+)
MSVPETKVGKNHPVPVTLLSGFLGSGKSSLIRHILQNKEGLRVAVIMNEITEVNLDAVALEGSKLLKTEEKLVEMANGCICCTLREDLLIQLRDLARSQEFDAVLIESSGIGEPMQVAETFFVDLEDGNDQLQKEAPLDNTVTVVDASLLEEHMESLQTIEELEPTADTSAEGQQDIAALLFAQLEFANVVLLNKTDLLRSGKGGTAKKKQQQRTEHEARLKAIVKKINPRVEVIGTQYARVPLTKILKTGNFTEEFATNASTQWMAEFEKNGVKHVPETEEFDMSGFYWSAKRPFHPKRLHHWFLTYFALKQINFADEDEDDGDEQEEKEDDAEDEIKQLVERKARLEEKYGNLFRSKGLVFIGGEERSKHVASWQQVGRILYFEPAGPRDSSDTTQKLTFVGQHLKHDVLKADLEALLMTPAEIKQLAAKPDCLDDPFNPFPDPSHYDHDEEEDALPTKMSKKDKAARKEEEAEEAPPKKKSSKASSTRS